MLDKIIQPYTQPFLKIIGKFFVKFLTPNQVSFIGFSLGLIMCVFIFLDFYIYALLALLLNRLLDGLDGAMARLTAPSHFGGYIDIVFDFIIYAAFILSFGLKDSSNLLTSCLLLFFYIGTGSTFLAYAAILKNYEPSLNLENNKSINKSIYYISGLVEGFETIIFMTLCLLIPEYYNFLAILFSVLCGATVVGRFIICYKKFN